MADRPFRNAGYGGVALLGEGIHQGVDNFVQNFLAMKRQRNQDRWQAMQEGALQGNQAPLGQPTGTPGGAGAAALATTQPGPADVSPAAAVPSARYLETQPGVPLPQGDSSGHPYFTQAEGRQPGVGQFPDTSTGGGETQGLSARHSVFANNDYQMQPDASVQPPPASAPQPMMAQAEPPGAQALASSLDQARSVWSAAPASHTKPVEEMSLDELRNLSSEHAKGAREQAKANERDMTMLPPAYHYSQQLKLIEPYLKLWEDALDETRTPANVTNPDSWNRVKDMTGEEDPRKAAAIAIQEYTKLRNQRDQYRSNYIPLKKELSARGITPDMYDNEAKFLDFQNQRKFQPHTPSTRGAGVMKTAPKAARR
jgi:hypothetical protein